MSRKFIMGTAVKITAILDTESPDSVQITVEDESQAKLVTKADMTQENTTVWSYVFQSQDSGRSPGTYRAIIFAKKGAYTSVTKQEFDMIDVIV